MNKTERMFATLLLLQAKRQIRSADLAAHFEVSTRTVYRDIQALCESGVPIVSDPRKGYSIMEGYFLPPLLFTPKEATILWIGTEFVREHMDSSFREDANSAFFKIEAVLPERIKSEIRELEKRIALRYREPVPDVSENVFLDQIREATVKCKLIRMTYMASSRKEAVEREVEPLGVVFSERHWYFVAYCRVRQAVRTFRIDRIQDLTVLEESFASRTDFSIQDYIARDRSGERRKSAGIPAKIIFSAAAAARAKKQVPWRIVGEETVPGEGVALTVQLDDYTWVINWVLSFGKEARITEPQSLRRQVLQSLAELSNHHGTEKKFLTE